MLCKRLRFTLFCYSNCTEIVRLISKQYFYLILLNFFFMQSKLISLQENELFKVLCKRAKNALVKVMGNHLGRASFFG